MNTRINIVLTPELVAAMHKAKQDTGVSVARLLTKAVEEFINSSCLYEMRQKMAPPVFTTSYVPATFRNIPAPPAPTTPQVHAQVYGTTPQPQQVSVDVSPPAQGRWTKYVNYTTGVKFATDAEALEYWDGRMDLAPKEYRKYRSYEHDDAHKRAEEILKAWGDDDQTPTETPAETPAETPVLNDLSGDYSEEEAVAYFKEQKRKEANKKPGFDKDGWPDGVQKGHGWTPAEMAEKRASWGK